MLKGKRCLPSTSIGGWDSSWPTNSSSQAKASSVHFRKRYPRSPRLSTVDREYDQILLIVSEFTAQYRPRIACCTTVTTRIDRRETRGVASDTNESCARIGKLLLKNLKIDNVANWILIHLLFPDLLRRNFFAKTRHLFRCSII